MHRRLQRLSRLVGVLALSATALLAFAVPASAARIRGVETVIEPTEQFRNALDGNGFALSVVAPGRARAPYIALPLTSGSLYTVSGGRRLRGYVNNAGGVAFTRGGVASSITNFKVVLGTRSYVGARVGTNRVRFLNLTGAAARATRTRVVVTADASLSTEAAVFLNRAFSTTNFSTSLPVGRITVEARPVR